jgi:predicted transcriptional regulator
MRQQEISVLDDEEQGQVDALMGAGFSRAESLILVALNACGETSQQDLELITRLYQSHTSIAVASLVWKGAVNRRFENRRQMVKLTGTLPEIAEMAVRSRVRSMAALFDRASKMGRSYAAGC